MKQKRVTECKIEMVNIKNSSSFEGTFPLFCNVNPKNIKLEMVIVYRKQKMKDETFSRTEDSSWGPLALTWL